MNRIMHRVGIDIVAHSPTVKASVRVFEPPSIDFDLLKLSG